MKRWPEMIAIGSIVAVLSAAVLLERAPAQRVPVAADTSATVGSTSEAATFLIRNARVFDGENVIDAANVLVRDGRIEAVGHDVAIVAGMRVIDATGKTLLPGLIDAHTHSWGDAQRDALRFGVTTEIDMHGDWHRLPALKSRRESLARNDQADLWAAGVAVTAPGGHGTQYGFVIPTVDASTDIPAFVAARVGEGADFIKLIIEDLSVYSATQRWPTLDQKQIAAVIASAHHQQRLAVAHVSRQLDARVAVDAGVDGLAHVFIDESASDEFVEAARRARLFIVPTLSVTASGSGAGDGRAIAADARLQAFLTPAQTSSLAAGFAVIEKNEVYRDHAFASVRRLHAAGVDILAGTDAGNPGTTHGASLHGELELLVRAGMPAQRALNAATALPARRFGMTERGRIAAGMRADMLLVDGDPLTDITVTRAIVTVWKNGFVVERAAQGEKTSKAMRAPTQPLISDFEGGVIDTTFGTAWRVTSDQMMGGASVAAQQLVTDGANGTTASLEISGEIKPGFA